MTSFETDPDFCPKCGAIFKLPTSSHILKCVVCKHTASLRDMINAEDVYSFEITPYDSYLVVQKRNSEINSDEVEGQLDNDRECSKCGHRGMAYTTMQLRSADEGQTIFYICPKCKHREVENS